MAIICKNIQLLHDNHKIYGKIIKNGEYKNLTKIKVELTKYMLCAFDAFLLRTNYEEIEINSNSSAFERQYMIFKLLHHHSATTYKNEYIGLIKSVKDWIIDRYFEITNPFLLAEIQTLYYLNSKFCYNINKKGIYKLYRKIYLENQLILKDYEDQKHLLRQEFEMYIKMGKISNNFCSFNKVNYEKEILTGIYDPRLITFQHMFDYDYMCIIPLLNIMNSVMKKNHFFHGDFKENNILIDPYTYNIQIIDLEHSKIIDKHTFFTDEDICINIHNYDKNDSKKTDNVIMYIDERYLYFYDMFKLVTTIYRKNILNNLNELFKYSKTQTHLDFLVIYNVYHNYKGEDKYDCRTYLYITPSKLVNKIMMTNVIMEERLMEHHEMIKNMIKENF